jgi:hypothetical protein
MLACPPYRKYGQIKPPLGAQILRGHDLASGLVGCWLFNEGGGTTLTDLSEKSFNGIITGPTWAAGKLGPALTCTYVTIPTGFYTTPSSKTFFMWVKTSVGGAAPWLLMYNGTTQELGLQLQSGGQVSFMVWLGGAKTATSTQSVNDGVWHQVVGVYDAVAQTVSVYVDGIRSATTAAPGVTAFEDDYLSFCGVGNGHGIGSSSFNGQIDNCMIYNRALNPIEILHLYTNPYAFIAPPQPIRTYFLVMPKIIVGASNIQGSASLISQPGVTHQAAANLSAVSSQAAKAKAIYAASASLVAGSTVGATATLFVGVIVSPPGIPSGEHFGIPHAVQQYTYTGAGTTHTGGTAGVRVQWGVTLPVLYNVNASFDVSLNVEYNIGHLPLYWFRIEGLCDTPTAGCPTAPLDTSGMPPIMNQSGRPIDQQCPQFTVQVVPATTPDDACLKVAQTGFVWQISRMSKFSVPVNPVIAQQQQDAGLIDTNCNTLTDVPFCQTANCKQFCLQTNARIGMGMAMTVIDTFLSYTGSGNIHLSGSAIAFRIPSAAVATAFAQDAQGGVKFGGRAKARSSHYQYIPDGQGPVNLLVGGDSKVKSSHQQYEGGGPIHFAGATEAVSTSYRGKATGTIRLGGSARLRSGRQYTPERGSKGAKHSDLKMGGTASIGPPTKKAKTKVTPLVDYNVNPTGIPSAETFGTAQVTPRIAPPSFFGGNAFGQPTLAVKAQYISMWGGHGTLVSMEPVYNGTPAPLIPPVTAFVPNDCGCLGLPYKLQVSHDLGRAVNLTNFLVRNGLTVPNPVTLFYSNTSKSYLSNTHLRGVAGDGTPDLWMVLFEWACTDFFGGLHIGSPLWRFSFLVTRRNPASGEFFETRMIAGFPPDTICADANMPGEGLNFGFKFNVNDLTFITKHNLRVDLSLLYDNLELFTSPDWAKNPLFAVNISALENPQQTPRQDISPIFPPAPSSTTNPIILA